MLKKPTLKKDQITFLKRAKRYTIEGPASGCTILDGNERRRAEAMKKLGYVKINPDGFTNWGRAEITEKGRKLLEEL